MQTLETSRGEVCAAGATGLQFGRGAGVTEQISSAETGLALDTAACKRGIIVEHSLSSAKETSQS